MNKTITQNYWFISAVAVFLFGTATLKNCWLAGFLGGVVMACWFIDIIKIEKIKQVKNG